MLSSTIQPKLTSAELAALWTQFINESAGLCFNKHMNEHLEDQAIKDIFETSISVGSQHVEDIKRFLAGEGYPIPFGFTGQDYIPGSPRLFSDVFCLHYINIMSIHGCHGYSAAVTTSTRSDVREYFTKCNQTAVDLCNQTKDVLLEKGIYSRPPALVPADKADFVKNDSFLAGWFGDLRPLSCIEITDIYFNLEKSIMAKAVMVAFSQVAHSEKVRDFLLKAIKVKDSHIQMFDEQLKRENLPAPTTLEAEITKSTTTPFSDRLMMFQVGFLFTTAMVYYGTGWASSARRDLTPKYMKAMSDDVMLGSDWMDLMIKNGWLEQPPLAEDRSKLAMMEK